VESADRITLTLRVMLPRILAGRLLTERIGFAGRLIFLS